MIRRLHEHTDIEEIDDTIAQYAKNCQNSTGPPVRELPICITAPRGRSKRWMTYRPTEEEIEALTKLWRTYIKYIAKIILNYNLSDQDREDILMSSYEILQIVASSYQEDRGSLRSFLYYNIRRGVSNAINNYSNKSEVFSGKPIEWTDAHIDPSTPIFDIDQFAEEVGAQEELEALTKEIEKII